MSGRCWYAMARFLRRQGYSVRTISEELDVMYSVVARAVEDLPVPKRVKW